MLFNSFRFAAFFIVVFCLYLLLSRKHTWQNVLLLVASYVFYAAWDWRFAFLLLGITILDYAFGLKISSARDQHARKLFLGFSVTCNLLVLGFFKYFNFFAASFQQLAAFLGISIPLHIISIILPIGVSFYTFQSMTYTIDIYRRQLEPTRNFIDYSLFVAFFPVLIAGPIERARHLLPQIQAPRILSPKGFYDGCFLIFWGLFEKVAVADNLARMVDPVFAAQQPYYGADVLLATYAFAFQIFCDFDGYSNIARGLGKCMGFDIMVNFSLPYFCTNPREFWRRWNISLSNWIRDYVYISLGGNHKGTLATNRNVMVAMVLAGLWHGASWTFILWGTYWGILIVLQNLVNKIGIKIGALSNKIVSGAMRAASIVIFFQLICVGWLLFRAQSIPQAMAMTGSLFNNLTLSTAYGAALVNVLPVALLMTAVLLAIQVIQYLSNNLLITLKWRWPFRAIVYCCLLLLLVIFGADYGKEFIYFQF